MIRKRAEYSDTIQQMKTTFLAERAEYTAQPEERIRELTREANKVSGCFTVSSRAQLEHVKFAIKTML